MEQEEAQPTSSSLTNESKSSWRTWVSGVLIAAVSALGASFLEETGKGLSTGLNAIWGRLTGSHTIHVLVFAEHGSLPLEGADVSVVPSKEGTSIVSRRSDKFGRATFDDIPEPTLYVQVTSTNSDGAIRCTKYDPPDKYPYTITIKVDEAPCVPYRLDPIIPAATAGASAVPWLAVAEREIGVKETVGPLPPNPRIAEYLATAGLPHADQSTPWGCAFIGWTLKKSGTQPPNAAAVCSNFLNYGTKLSQPKIGALGFIGSIGIPEARTGLVGIVTEVGESDVAMIVGNVNNSVTRSTFPMKRVEAFVWPPAPALATE